MSGAVHQQDWKRRVDSADWPRVAAELDEFGGALLPALLSPADATALRERYDDDAQFRATIDMDRYRFGRGEYRYFDRPLPDPVSSSNRRSTRACCRSHATGGADSDAMRPGPTPSMSGWPHATPPARPGLRRSCSDTAPGTGMRFIGTCTET